MLRLAPHFLLAWAASPAPRSPSHRQHRDLAPVQVSARSRRGRAVGPWGPGSRPGWEDTLGVGKTWVWCRTPLSAQPQAHLSIRRFPPSCPFTGCPGHPQHEKGPRDSCHLLVAKRNWCKEPCMSLRGGPGLVGLFFPPATNSLPLLCWLPLCFSDSVGISGRTWLCLG